jgi:hypothetical protein
MVHWPWGETVRLLDLHRTSHNGRQSIAWDMKPEFLGKSCAEWLDSVNLPDNGGNWTVRRKFYKPATARLSSKLTGSTPRFKDFEQFHNQKSNSAIIKESSVFKNRFDQSLVNSEMLFTSLSVSVIIVCLFGDDSGITERLGDQSRICLW